MDGDAMKTMQAPVIVLAQFMGENISGWMASRA
jgi:hypothetical protein